QFLVEQQARVSPATYRKYETVVDLFKAYCERYWPGHSDEYDRVTKASGTFCGTYGPEDILGGYSEFLGYFMPHKVLGSKETMKAAGTVTKKLAKWLAAKGYGGEGEDGVDEAKRAAKELPATQDLLDLLGDYVAAEAPADDECERFVEDHLLVKRVEPGKLWLEPFTATGEVIGPITVPEEVTRQCKEGWDIGGVLGETP